MSDYCLSPDGYDENGFDEHAYDRDGFDKNDIHRETGTKLNPNGRTREEIHLEILKEMGVSVNFRYGSGINPEIARKKREEIRILEEKRRYNSYIVEVEKNRKYKNWQPVFELLSQWSKYSEKEQRLHLEKIEELMAEMEWREADLLLNVLITHPKTKVRNLLNLLISYNVRTEYNRLEKYIKDGFNISGIHRDTQTEFNQDGYTIGGHNADGFNRSGIHKETGTKYDLNGFDVNRHNFHGFFRSGLHKNTQTEVGPDGYMIDGHNADGFNRSSIHKETGTKYDLDGFDINRHNSYGFFRSGLHKDTQTEFDTDGYMIDGHNADGFNRSGKHKETGTKYDPDGFDVDGYNQERVDRKGYISPKKWFETVAAFREISRFRTKWDAKTEYCLLTDQDRKLAFNWANSEKQDDFTKAKMLSARAAEKVSCKFYESLDYKTEDVSIHQIQYQFEDSTKQKQLRQEWITCDLILDGEIRIDIKNSRTSAGSKNRYVEHCVSKFKRDRNNHDIIIAGVLSPYVKLGYIEDKIRHEYDYNILYLGETTYSYLKLLEKWFSKKGFLDIRLDGMNFIPPWVFEFPKKFYTVRDKKVEVLKNVKLKDFPKIEVCNKNGLNPLPAYFLSGIELPEIWKSELREWQVNFYKRLKTPTTLPILFLALLTHFLEMVKNGKECNGYDPVGYRTLLYDNADNYLTCNPLGIFDQINIIGDFIYTLSILWINRDETNLSDFDVFKFNGTGLLQGKMKNDENFITILAYCGGFINGIGKCGNSPLIIGREKNCPECGKLICEVCGYCSPNENCSQCEGRMGEYLENSIDFPNKKYTVNWGISQEAPFNPDDTPF